MLSLPIVFREFLVTSRRKRTFVIRCVFGGFLAWGVSRFGIELAVPGTAPAGQSLFDGLAWIVFVLLFAGVPALASGCISDERNDGTLGLLFLTHLNSADVVLGKFLSRGFDALLLFLSAVPFLFVPILLGGVDLNQPLGLTISMLGLIVLALAVGVFSSMIARSTGQAWSLAYALLGICAGLPIVLPLVNGMNLPFGWGQLPIVFPASLRVLSPASGLTGLGAYHAREALLTLLGCGAVAGVLLGFCIWRLPHTLHLDGFRETAGQSFSRWLARLPLGVFRIHRSRAAMDESPVLWLQFRRHSPVATGLLVLTGVCVGVGAASLVSMAGGWRSASSLIAGGGLVLLSALKVLLTLSAARAFSVGKQDGSLELLLTTPLTNREIAQGWVQAILARHAWLLGALAGYLAGIAITELSALEGIFLLVLLAFVSLFVFVDILYTVNVSLLISARAKSPAQAILLSLLATIGAFWVLSCCAVIVEPIVAAVCYSKLTQNLRQYAAR